MNLADMLCFADIHQLNRIAQKYELSCSSNSKNELIQSILSKVYRKDVVKQVVSNLPLEDLRFINSVLFDRKNKFSLEELTARVKETWFQQEEQQRNPRDIISEYRQRGWLFNGISNDSKYLFQFPEDLKQRIGAIMREQLSQELAVTGVPEIYKDEQELLKDDILLFLDYLSRYDVPLTTAGFMYKRQLQQLLKAMAIEESMDEKQAWRFGYGRRYKEYPDRFSYIYDYCYFNGYIEETNDQLVLTNSGETLLAEKSGIDPMDLYRFWIRLYKGPVPNIQAMVHWIDQLASDWVTVHSITAALHRFVKPFYYDSPEDVLQKRLMKMMLHLGLISMGEHREYGQVIRTTEIGRKIIRGTYVKEDDYIEISETF